MLTIRLQRVGRKNDPSFRVIVTDSKHKPKTGKFLEVVGSYDPRVDRTDLKSDRIKHWMSEGAQVSDTVHNILVKANLVEGKKRHLSNPSGPRLAKIKKTAADAVSAKAAAELAAVEAEKAAAEAAAAPAPEEVPAPETPSESNNEVAEEAAAQ